MKVWIDQDLCTGDGLCEEIAPDVFTLLDDGLAYVVEGDKVFLTLVALRVWLLFLMVKKKLLLNLPKSALGNASILRFS